MTKERKLQTQEYAKQKNFLIILSVAATFGFCIWAFSPLLTGHNEPWDAEYPFYLPVSIVGGVVLGLLAPRYMAACYLGVWLGQVLAFGVLPGLDRGWLLLASDDDWNWKPFSSCWCSHWLTNHKGDRTHCKKVKREK